MAEKGYYQIIAKGLILHIRLTPRAKTLGIAGLYQADDGKCYLNIKVHEPPEDGKANKALLNYLAKFFAIKKTALILDQGQTARYKRIMLQVDNKEAMIHKLEDKLDIS